MPYSMPLAPWLQSPASQVGQLYTQGLAQGARIASERSRAADALAQNEAEMQFKAQQLQQEQQYRQQALQAGMIKAQQELLMEKAYKDQLVELRARGLDLNQAKLKLASDVAARKFAAQQDLGKRLASGESFESAMFANPDLMTPGVTEALIRGRQAQKEYGPVISEEIEGVPGGRAVYRKGSPGVHVVTPPRTGLTALQRAKIEDTIGKIEVAKSEVPAGDPLQKNYEDQIARYRAILNSEMPTPVQQVNTNQYPQGAVLRRKDGSRWLVSGNSLVPLDTPQETEPTKPTEPTTFDQSVMQFPDEEEEDAGLVPER